MAYDQIIVPKDGEKITVAGDKLDIPDHPILAFIEGDGIGPDINTASKRIWDAAVARRRRRQRWEWEWDRRGM